MNDFVPFYASQMGARPRSKPAPVPKPPEAARPRMRLTSFKQIAGAGAMRGLATLRLPNGLLLKDCPVFATRGGRAWAVLPSRPLIGKDGRQLVSDAGVRQWEPTCAWPDRATNDAWSQRVIELVRHAHPEALADEAGS